LLATVVFGRETDSSQSSGKVKAGQIWSKNKDELTKQLGELKTELGQLRIQKITSSGAKLTKMYGFLSLLALMSFLGGKRMPQ